MMTTPSAREPESASPKDHAHGSGTILCLTDRYQGACYRGVCRCGWSTADTGFIGFAESRLTAHMTDRDATDLRWFGVHVYAS